MDNILSLQNKSKRRKEFTSNVRCCILPLVLVRIGDRWHEHFNLHNYHIIIIFVKYQALVHTTCHDSSHEFHFISSNFDHATICWQSWRFRCADVYQCVLSFVIYPTLKYFPSCKKINKVLRFSICFATQKHVQYGTSGSLE